MTDETPGVKRIHELYCRLSGRPQKLMMQHIFAWQQFKVDFTEEDLTLVINLLKAKIKAGQKWDSCLSFTNLIHRTDTFSELLAEAKSLARVPKTTPRDRILAQTGHEAPAKESVRTAAQILAASEALAEMRKFRESL